MKGCVHVPPTSSNAALALDVMRAQDWERIESGPIHFVAAARYTPIPHPRPRVRAHPLSPTPEPTDASDARVQTPKRPFIRRRHVALTALLPCRAPRNLTMPCGSDGSPPPFLVFTYAV